MTDENGCATIDYYNGRNATYMNVDIVTLVDGKPAAVNTLFYPTRKRWHDIASVSWDGHPMWCHRHT